MTCRNCLELEQFLNSALVPDAPELSVGLSEAATRNRMQQKQEKLAKLRADLERHRNSCVEVAESKLAAV